MLHESRQQLKHLKSILYSHPVCPQKANCNHCFNSPQSGLISNKHPQVSRNQLIYATELTCVTPPCIAGHRLNNLELNEIKLCAAFYLEVRHPHPHPTPVTQGGKAPSFLWLPQAQARPPGRTLCTSQLRPEIPWPPFQTLGFPTY